MCRSPLKFALNPHAEEWRPSRRHLPLLNLYPVSHGFISCRYAHFPTYYPTFSAAAAAPIPPPPPQYLYGCLSSGIRVSKPVCRGGDRDFPGEGFESRSEKMGASKMIKPRFGRDIPPRMKHARKQHCLKKVWRAVKPPSPVRDEVNGNEKGLPASLEYETSDASNTTVMIKNIPNRLRRDFLLKFLDDRCKSHPQMEYDFLYLPMDFRKEGNLGYAFVNFTSNAAALQFKNALCDYKWQTVYTERGPITSKKVCDVTWARIQGKEALVRRFTNSTFYCNKKEFLPVVLAPPRNGSDPDRSHLLVLGRLQTRDYY